MKHLSLGLLAATTLLLSSPAARAEVSELRISQQFGIGYLPVQVARHRGLFEAQAKAQGLDGLKVSFVTLGSGASGNDALLSDGVDIVTGGVGPFLAAWGKTRGNFDVRGLAALCSLPIALISTNPAVTSLADFTAKDRIGLPAVKVSIQAVTLQIAAEKAFGPGQHERLDPFTVSIKHPDAYAALASGRSEITAHFGSAPYSQQELRLPNARKITDSYQALGGPATFNVAWAKASFHDRNPKVVKAFVEALREADAFIAAHPDEAARIHLLEDQGSADETLVRSIITDPESHFTVVPLGTTKYADFLYRTGQIKTRPAGWTDLFFPEIATESGS